MDVILNLMQYVIIFIEVFIWWRLTKSVLNMKYDKKYHMGLAVSIFLLMVIKQFIFLIPNLVPYQAVGTIILMTYTFVAGLLLFKNSFVEKLVWFGVFYLGLIIMELATILLLSLVLNKSLADLSMNDQMSMWVIAFGKIMTLLLFEMIIRKHNGKMVIGFSYFKELAILIVFNLVLLLAVVFIFTNKQDITNNIDNIILFIFGVVLLITVCMILLIFKIEKKSKEELATQLKLQQIELELKLNNDMIRITDNLRKLRHDMNNHIGLIKTLASSNKYDDLNDYINQIYEDVEIANELVITENKTLSVLLNAKKSLAKAKNIDFQSMITIKDIKMQNKDICALVGNILDNAIEAAEKTKAKKYIELSIQKTEEGCVINCENSLGVKPIIKKADFVTLKENSLIHGIGTKNIKEIVAKYKGEVNFDYDDEMFNVRVVMPV